VTSLADLQIEWLRLHSRLGECVQGQLLAAPFLSFHQDIGTNGQASKPILLVGQATAGNWWLEDFVKARKRSFSQGVAERLACTDGHLKWRDSEDDMLSAFWRFRRGLKLISNPVIWTNLAKIGVHKGNPKWRLVREQSELACRTIIAEISEYKPSLIVLATGDFGRHEVVWPTFGEASSWKDDLDTGCKWQERSCFGMPVLWVGHPGFKQTTKTEIWLRKARELLELAG
jgi:hypothetical protein